MTGHLRFALLALASLLLLQFAAAQFDPAACSENCRFVVVPSLGPAGPPGLDGLNGVDGRDGLNGTDGANGLNGADGRDGLNGTNGRDGAAGTIDTSAVVAGLQVDGLSVTSGALTVPEGGLSIAGGGLNLPNPGTMGATSLDHYEYASFDVTMAGNFGATLSLEFTRIGRHVTMMLPGAMYPGVEAGSVYSTGESNIPPQFRPSMPMRFGILSMNNNVRGVSCIEIGNFGNIQIWGGWCGIYFPLTSGGTNGWDPTAIHWLTL
jgi:hypothetical protein